MYAQYAVHIVSLCNLERYTLSVDQMWHLAVPHFAHSLLIVVPIMAPTQSTEGGQGLHCSAHCKKATTLSHMELTDHCFSVFFAHFLTYPSSLVIQ